MNYKHLIIATGLLAMAVSCAKIETEPAGLVPAIGSETISIPVVCEDDSADTKAYMYNNVEGSYWTYIWEHGDYFHYFYYSRAQMLGHRFAAVSKTPYATMIDYTASDLELGNDLYSYFIQKDMLGEAPTNNDPSAIKMIIPSLQVSDRDAETFHEVIDPSFGLDVNITTLNAGLIGDFLETKTVPDLEVFFTILDFNPEYTYSCSLISGKSVYDFSYDENGHGSVKVSFEGFEWGKGTEVKTKFKVVNDNYSENSVNVEAKATRSSVLADECTYAVSVTGSASDMADKTSYGEAKPYHIREAMPCASRVKTVTTSLLRYPSDIANSMTMYMLGSAIEFRVYSGTTHAHVGEDIIMANVSTIDHPCAGECYYNLLAEDLTLTGFDENNEANYSITSNVEALGYKVPAAKDLNQSFFMVIAPGTYTGGKMTIVTKDANGNMLEYRFNLSSNPFTRATKKPLAINLDNVTPIPYVDPNAPSSEDDEEEEAI